MTCPIDHGALLVADRASAATAKVDPFAATTVFDASTLPHPPRRLPLLGDVLGISPSRPTQDSMRMGRGLGPMYVRRIFNREIVFATSAEITAELADEARFAKHVGLGLLELRPLGGDGLFTAFNHEANWQRAHNILLPAFTANPLRGYHPTMLAVARQLLAKWDRQARAVATVHSPTVDVVTDMTRLTLETIGLTGFDYEFGAFQRAEPHPFVKAMTGALRFAQQESFMPLAAKLDRKGTARNRANLDYMFSEVDRVIAARRASGERSDRDLLGMMLAARDPQTGEALDDINIRHQIVTFLIAGHETTSGALGFALYYLLKNPDVLARAQAEVDQVWGRDLSIDPTYQQVTKLRYVRRVLDEALRLWPTAPGYARHAREDTTLAGKYRIRKGEWLFVLLPLVHRDQEVWGEDPESFDPDRFEPAQVKARPAHSYKPFGTGERACIGRPFALHEAVLVLGMLLQRYDLHDTKDYQLKISELLTIKPEGLRMSITARR